MKTVDNKNLKKNNNWYLQGATATHALVVIYNKQDIIDCKYFFSVQNS